MVKEIDAIVEFKDVKEVNAFLEKELGGKSLIEIPNPSHDKMIAKTNAHIRTQLKQFDDKFKKGFNVCAIRNKCICGNVFFAPYIRMLKDDDSAYVEAKKGVFKESICGSCYSIGSRLRDMGIEKAYTNGVMNSIWNCKKGCHLIIRGSSLKFEKDLNIKQLMDIGYTTEIILIEPKIGHLKALEEFNKKELEKEEHIKNLNLDAKK